MSFYLWPITTGYDLPSTGQRSLERAHKDAILIYTLKSNLTRIYVFYLEL